MQNVHKHACTIHTVPIIQYAWAYMFIYNEHCIHSMKVCNDVSIGCTL